MREELMFLGLTKNEIDIYIALLKNPSATGAQLKRLTHISNSRVYSSLDSLIGKGLVIYNKISTGRLFSAVAPDILKQLMEERKQQIEALMPALKEMQVQTRGETQTAVYEGLKGFKTAVYRFLDESPRNSVLDIVAFSNVVYKNQELFQMLKIVNEKLYRKKVKMRVLTDHGSIIRKLEHYQQRTEMRSMPKGYVSPCAIDITNGLVGIFIWGEAPYAFLIKNKGVAQGFRSYFNFLWSMAK